MLNTFKKLSADNWVSKVLGIQASRPEFDIQNHHKNNGMVVGNLKPSTGEAKTRRSLRLSR